MKIKTWWDYADYHHEPGLDSADRGFSPTERTCVARIMRLDHSGENRFYIAPASDGTWFAWGDWHGRIEENSGPRMTVVSEEADDATYTFADGGAFFPSREAAMLAIYRWIERDLKLDLRHSNQKVSA
jgi:hypothetical protein